MPELAPIPEPSSEYPAPNSLAAAQEYRSDIPSTDIQNKRTQKRRPHMWQELSFGAALYEKQPRIWF